MKRLVVIDGKSVFYRGYYAMPGLSLRDGTPTGGVFGFASIGIEIIKRLEPDYIAVAWDIKGTSTAKRTKIFAEYKAGRTKPPEDFYAQLPALREVLAAFNWPLYELDEYEADDIIGTFSLQAAEQNIETCVVSGDYDMLQLLSPHTKVYITKKGSTDLIEFDNAAFEEKYGVKVNQFVDYKALVGDKSDNIPGVTKIGPKAAETLLKNYETLEGVYENLADLKGAQKKNLETDRDNAFMSQKLARIYCDAPISINWEECDIHRTEFDKVADVLKKFEFNSLLRRLPKHMQEKTGNENQGSLFDVTSPSNAESLEEVAWPETLTFDANNEVLVHVSGNEAWLSLDKKTVMRKPLSEVDAGVWRALESVHVVSYDAKTLYHAAHEQGTEIRFDVVHDVRQGAFLLDPLARDRSISGLAGESLDETNPGQVAAALWRAYSEQKHRFKDEPRIAEVAHSLDFPLTYMLYEMESRGIKIDKAQFAKMSQELGDEHQKLEQEMYTMVGYEFNIGSPTQLSEVLFTKLQLPTTGIKKGKTGYSTGQKELDKLRGQHPIIELIERTRELAKLKNTYVDTLPELTDLHDRIHTDFKQDVAATGRLSSTNPNLQNIPVRTDLGRRIREAFVPEGDKVFVGADYSQFELRLAAVLAGDETLINDFNGDVDIHTKTAAQVYKIPMDDVTKTQRRAAKVINFGVLYGMSPHGLSAATGMNFSEAKHFIDEYFELRAPIRAYIDATLEKAKTDGYVETYFGRRRPTPDVNSSNFMVREGAKRAAANMPIQGTEADLMKMAMLRVDEKIGDLGEQILQVHDSILVECPKENAEKVSELLRDTMENIYPELNVKLRVDVAIGDNWSQL